MANLTPNDKLALISNLATMLSAGIPILEAVDTMLEDSKGAMKKVLLMLKASLSEGKPLSHAFEKMPKVFDPVTINLTKAAEEAGTLEETLKDLAVSIQKEMDFSSKLRASLTYPMFVMGVFVFVLVVILTFVIPRVSKVFGGLRVDVPPITQFMMEFSALFLARWPLIVGGLAVIAIGIGVLYAVQRRAIINLLLSLPGLRKLGRQIDFARFTRSMGLLLKAGLPVAEALELAQKTVVKKDVVVMLGDIKSGVLAGKPFVDGMRQHKKIVPSIMLRTTEAAENSGTLEVTMKDLGKYFEDQVDKTLRAITSLIEPVMLVVIGVLVGGMMLAVIAPIYNLITQINTR